MRENFKGNKRRIEEMKKKKQLEKRNRRLNQKSENAPPEATPEMPPTLL